MCRFFLVFALLVGLAPVKSHAESVDADSTALLVHIRAIRASKPLEDEGKVTLQGDSAPARGNVQYDTRIKDLAPKLSKLHFRCFKLISSQHELVPLGKRETVTLVEGNQLTLRPLTLDSKRVGMWIKWQDGSGMQVLDTRMHFDLGESMLTGVDAAADSGMILAIDVTTVDRHAPVVQPVLGAADLAKAK